jgi:hypothetical protein
MGARTVDQETIQRWIAEAVAANPGGSLYLVYTATASQSSTDAPFAVVLANTLGGTLVWGYDAQGAYRGTLAGAFPDPDKVIILMGNGGNRCIITNGVIDANNIFIETADAAGVYQNDLLQRTSIEIRVYP